MDRVVGRAGVSAAVLPASAHGGLVRTGRGDIVVVPTFPAEEIEVPDFRGMSVRLSRQTAASLGLTLTFHGNGRVIEQSPRPGCIVGPGHGVDVRCRP